jgi:rod shape-determining protein MreB and related proteins
MIKKLFTHDLYIKVSKNKFEAKNLSANGGWQSAYPESPFTTDRLLVGSFTAAETTLSELVKKMLPKGFITKSPQVVIQPVAMIEGGLSEVEERIFKELALGSGAFKVVLHVGAELSDSEAVALIGSA